MDLINLATNHTTRVLKSDYHKKGSYITAHLECVELRKKMLPCVYKKFTGVNGLRSYILNCLREICELVDNMCDTIELVNKNDFDAMIDFLNEYNSFKLNYIDISHNIDCSLRGVRDAFGIAESEIKEKWEALLSE